MLMTFIAVFYWFCQCYIFVKESKFRQMLFCLVYVGNSQHFYNVLADKIMLPGTAVFWARNDTVNHYHFHQKRIWYDTIECNFMRLIYWCICNTSSNTICSGFKSQFMGFHAFHNRVGTVKRGTSGRFLR